MSEAKRRGGAHEGVLAGQDRRSIVMSATFEPFLRQLRHDLAGDLPGQIAQYQMAPQPRPNGALPYDQPRPDARRGGVLILLYPRQRDEEDDWAVHLPLILRPTYNGVHSGQVALPGGGFEEGDGDLTGTALREAYEEIGAPADQLMLLGQLSPLYVFVSNYLVFPTVAWTPNPPGFRIDPYEVAQLLETPLVDLLNPANRQREERALRDRMADVPFFAVQGQKIWGATAMMLSELLALPAMTLIRDNYDSS
jgi:8-oxo-dGTP pyrophosphatase MutT (NUDIX family)